MVTVQRRLTRYWWIPVIGFAVFGLDYTLAGGKARTVQGVLERELQTLPAPPMARLQNHHASSKPRQAVATNCYAGELSASAVFRHYQDQLAQTNWAVCGVSPIKQFGNVLGEWVSYCNRNRPGYKISVETATPARAAPWAFCVSYSWGL